MGMTPSMPTPGVGYATGYEGVLPSTPGIPQEVQPMVNDYKGVLMIVDGDYDRQGEVIGTRGDGTHEVRMQDGTMCVVDVVELVRPSKGDMVKVVSGEVHLGMVAKLISIDGTDGVLTGGTMIDMGYLGKLKDQSQ
jgi:hypothetical protein